MIEDGLGEGLTLPSPGPVSAGWLAAVDPRTADRATLLDALAVTRRLAGWVAAVEVSVLAALQADMVGTADEKEFVSEEVGLILRLPGDFARSRMVEGFQVARRLPATHALLAAGAVTPMQARLLADAVLCLDDQQCADVEARVLLRAADQTSTQFRKSLNRAVMAVAPVAVEQEHAEAVAGRRVEFRPADEPGMAAVFTLLPAPEAMRLKTAIKRLAMVRRDDAERAAEAAGIEAPATTSAAYEADALIELGDRWLAHADPSGTIGRHFPSVQVVVSVETLTGDSDEPAELIGHGPIPAGLARRIAADPGGTWQRLVTDSMGVLVDYGRERYRPPKALADFVRTKHRTCTFPNCNRAATSCELDHAQDWDHGGTTCEANLTPVCLRHHHVKHDAGWSLEYDSPTNVITWTSPTGRKYRNPRPD